MDTIGQWLQDTGIVLPNGLLAVLHFARKQELARRWSSPISATAALPRALPQAAGGARWLAQAKGECIILWGSTAGTAALAIAAFVQARVWQLFRRPSTSVTP